MKNKRGIMGKKEGYGRKGVFGEIKHYDAKEHKTGQRNHDIFGGWDYYDD